MVAENDIYLSAASESLYIMNQDKIFAEQCRAREDALRRERLAEKAISEYDNLKKEYDEQSAKLTEQNAKLTEQNAKLSEKEKELEELKEQLAELKKQLENK